MDLQTKTPGGSLGQGTVVLADNAHSATPAAPVNEPVTPEPATRKRLNAASGEVIDRLKVTHPAFSQQRPLAIGTHVALIAAHPDIAPALIRTALARWCARPRYLKAIDLGGPRVDLGGTPCGEVSEEHRVAATLVLARRAEWATKPRPPAKAPLTPPGRTSVAGTVVKAARLLALKAKLEAPNPPRRAPAGPRRRS